MTTYPALEFLRKVEIWQHAPGGTAGLAVTLPEDDEVTLAGLLTAVRNSGGSAGLEDRARFWLIGYRETNPPLTGAQRTELDTVIDRDPQWWPPYGPVKVPAGRKNQSRTRQRVIIAVVTGALALTAGIFTRAALSGNGEQGSPPAAGAPADPAQQIPAAATDLQHFRADWNVPAAAQASAGGGTAALVLLQDGLYYPAPWTVPAGDPGWTADSSGSVTASVHDGLADVTDSDGTAWTVAVGQPFVLSPNPQVVFRILRDAAVQSMPQPHAIAVRIPVTTGR